jgi:hypothetical protein
MWRERERLCIVCVSVFGEQKQAKQKSGGKIKKYLCNVNEKWFNYFHRRQLS